MEEFQECAELVRNTSLELCGDSTEAEPGLNTTEGKGREEALREVHRSVILKPDPNA